MNIHGSIYNRNRYPASDRDGKRVSGPRGSKARDRPVCPAITAKMKKNTTNINETEEGVSIIAHELRGIFSKSVPYCSL